MNGRNEKTEGPLKSTDMTATSAASDTRQGVYHPILPVGTDRSHRLGFGTMQLTGPGHWGPPHNIDGAIHLLRTAVEEGITHIDTADAYGPSTAETLIRRALHPYPPSLLLATKGGMTRQGPNQWAPLGRPEYLRQCVEMSLRRLQLERIDLYYLHRIDPEVPLEDQLGVLTDMQQEGKIEHLGLSKVTLPQILQAGKHALIASVQNKYSLGNREYEGVLQYCTQHEIPFVPYAPLDAGRIFQGKRRLTCLARSLGATPAQLSLAWLLHRSPAMMPIPGTSSIHHLQDNLLALQLELSAEDMQGIEREAEQEVTFC